VIPAVARIASIVVPARAAIWPSDSSWLGWMSDAVERVAAQLELDGLAGGEQVAIGWLVPTR
jgi:hypothetical protein